jgi:hypothetical protein
MPDASQIRGAAKVVVGSLEEAGQLARLAGAGRPA